MIKKYIRRKIENIVKEVIYSNKEKQNTKMLGSLKYLGDR